MFPQVFLPAKKDSEQGSDRRHSGEGFRGSRERSAALALSLQRLADKPEAAVLIGYKRAFVATNPTGESIVSDLPVVRQLFGNPMRCTLLTQRLPYFEVSGDSCPLWPRF
jgi:hypothetical protein